MSACTSSSGTTQIIRSPERAVPLAAVGFADADTGFEDPLDFAVRDSIRLIEDADGNIVFDRQDLALRGDFSGGPMTIVLDGKTYVLPRDPEGAFSWRVNDGADQVIFSTFSGGSNVAAMSEVFAIIDGDLNAAYLVFGYDTNPARIAALDDEAVYDGRVLATLRNTDLGSAFGDGSMRMNVDFDTGLMSGTASVVQTEGGSLAFEPFTFSFEETRLIRNEFDGDVSVLLGDIDGTLQDATYEGRFFGANGESIAGNIAARIDGDGVEADTLVEAAFVANQTSPD